MLAFSAGGCTSIDTGPVVVVSAFSSSVTPGIALVSLFEVELPATPSIVYLAFLPSLAVPACSTSVPPASVTAMKPAPVAPVSRVESTTVSLPTAAAYTVAVESELIVFHQVFDGCARRDFDFLAVDRQMFRRPRGF